LKSKVFKPGELERKPGKAERVIYVKEEENAEE